MRVLLCVLLLGLLTHRAAAAADACQVLEDHYRSQALQFARLIRESTACKQDRAALSQANAFLQVANDAKDAELTDNDVVKVKAEVRHDHEKFVFGSHYYLRIHIRNDAKRSLFIPLGKTSIHVPSELMIEDGRPNCERAFGATTEFNGEGALQVPSNSEHVIVWDCRQASGPSTIINSFVSKLFFRPDQYTFVVNVPFEYHYDNKKSVGTITKTAEAKVTAELDGFFVSVSSIFGALIAVVSRTCFQFAENYSLRRLEWPRKFSFECRKIWVDAGLFSVVALLLPPLLVAGANVTQKFDHGVAIKIFDFFGAALAGFLVQMLIMKLGQPAVDRMLGHQP